MLRFRNHLPTFFWSSQHKYLYRKFVKHNCKVSYVAQTLKPLHEQALLSRTAIRPGCSPYGGGGYHQARVLSIWGGGYHQARVLSIWGTIRPGCYATYQPTSSSPPTHFSSPPPPPPPPHPESQEEANSYSDPQGPRCGHLATPLSAQCGGPTPEGGGVKGRQRR